MNVNFNIEDAVRKRYSVRNYKDMYIGEEVINEMKSFIDSLENPFGEDVTFHFLNKDQIQDEKNIGTYGVIRGAKQYIGSTIRLQNKALEALGYEFEVLMLYLAQQGIGTCWLGGTFDRKGFAKEMKIDEDVSFPIISPYGYPETKKHLKERAMRKMIKADKRVDWEELFFKDNFETVLTEQEADIFAFSLEMLRLAPSASNKQPWRVLYKEDTFHFYEYKEPGYSDRFPYDIQRIDMGIAAAHFDLSVKERGINGYFEILEQHEDHLPDNFIYCFSWKKD